MIEIKLEEASAIKIGMEIEGNAKGAAELRFSVLSEGVRYSFPAKQVDDGVYEIHVPKMLGKVNEGVYEAEVEIIIAEGNHGKHFVPLTETVKFTKEVRPVVKLAETVRAVEKETAIRVKLGEVKKSVRVTDAKSLLESVQDGDTVNTAQMLTGLVGLLEAQSLSEKEALAAIKMVEFYGTDIETLPEVTQLAEMSARVREELVPVLRDKGISTNRLKAAGLL
jgi:hypothetical protein